MCFFYSTESVGLLSLFKSEQLSAVVNNTVQRQEEYTEKRD